MDRIDKFLNRRKEKNKRTVKLRDKYFEITKEDIKVVRKYKKNVCLDESVDMYRPYSTKFTLDTMAEPLKEYKTIEKSERTLKKEKLNFLKKNRDRVTKRRSIVNYNKIEDVWKDDGLEGLRNYEQNIILDIKDQYKGVVDDLKLDKRGLEQELRKVYLKQYLPRERKQYKVTDIVKQTPSINSLEPYPKEIACYWDRKTKEYVVNGDKRLFLIILDNVLEVYTITSILIFQLKLPEKIDKAQFGLRNEIICSFKRLLFCIEEQYYSTSTFINLDLKDKIDNDFNTLNNVSFIEFKSPIIDFSCNQNNLIGCIIGRNLVLVDFIEKKFSILNKFEGGTLKTITFHPTYTLTLITTSNSIIVFDIHTKKELANSKLFSYVICAKFSDNYIYIVTNTGNLSIFDYNRNVVAHTMYIEQEGVSMDVHLKYNLVALSTKKELIIFYCDVVNLQFVVVRRIEGLYGSLDFHNVCPWLYCEVEKKMVMLLS